MSGRGRRALANNREQLQNACMPAITIRDVPNETRDRLAERAAASGRSLQQYLRAELIRLAERPDNHAIVARAQARTRQTGGGLTGEQILELLDADRAERE
jgi:plasmid stability protein